jgi:hypothetical protein
VSSFFIRPISREDLVHVLATGGASDEAEANGLLDAFLAEYVGELGDNARPFARAAAQGVLASLMPGQTGVNFANEVADKIVAKIFAQDEEPSPRCPRCNGLGQIPDFTDWNREYGEPRPKPCPACTPKADR